MAESWRNAGGRKVLVTGAAGFIGFHLSRRLLTEGFKVLGVDNLTPYYDPLLKKDRLEQLAQFPNFRFHDLSISSEEFTLIHLDFKPDFLIHLAAQAGVRYSLENPWAYVDSNLVGFQRVIESLRVAPVKHFIFASSSSVYGASNKLPYSVEQRADNPVSMYAATKRSNELMASTYAHLFKFPTTGLRFFTVYGSWGRPDMAYFSFTKKILRGETLQLFNHGKLKRDFTHINDIVDSLCALIGHAPEGTLPFRLLNIGASQPIPLMDFVKTLEEVIGKKAVTEFLPMQLGDVFETWADVSSLEKLTGIAPKVSLKEGLREFYSWFESQKALSRYK